MPRHLVCGFAAIACLALGGCLSTLPPYRPAVGALADVGPSLNAYSQATVPKAGLIVVEGDNLAYGEVLRGKAAHRGVGGVWQAKAPFPEVLNGLLGVRVENRGEPGQTLAEGERLWSDKPCGNLLILAYGYSDAQRGVKAADFSAALSRRIAEAHAKGASVILVSPPHFRSKRVERSAEALRTALKAAQTSQGVGLVDLAPILAKIDPRPNPGAYQDQAAYRTIAYAVAAYIAVAQESAPPSSSMRPLTPDPS